MKILINIGILMPKCFLKFDLATFSFLTHQENNMETQNNNLYAQLTQKWHMMVSMPFKTKDNQELILPMVVLSGRELYEAKQKAEEDTRKSYGKEIPKKDESSEWENRYTDNLAYWTIFYSVRQPNDLNKRLFPTKDAVMDCITADQAGILSNHYMTVQLNQPWLTHLSNDDPDKLEALLQKIIDAGTKDPHFFLNSLTSHAQNALINFMAAKLERLQMDNGLLTEQLKGMKTNEETQSNTSEESL